MRTLLALVLLASTAFADPLPAVTGVPGPCAELAQVPKSATIDQPSLEARISAATCAAEVKLNALKLGPDDASVKAVGDAAAPSLDWLNSVIQAGDAVWSPVAQKAKAGLYVAMAVRMRNAVPAITMTTVGAALAAHDQDHAAVEARVKPWLDQAK